MSVFLYPLRDDKIFSGGCHYADNNLIEAPKILYSKEEKPAVFPKLNMVCTVHTLEIKFIFPTVHALQIKFYIS